MIIFGKHTHSFMEWLHILKFNNDRYMISDGSYDRFNHKPLYVIFGNTNNDWIKMDVECYKYLSEKVYLN